MSYHIEALKCTEKIICSWEEINWVYIEILFRSQEKNCSNLKRNIFQIAREVVFRSHKKYCSDHKRNIAQIARDDPGRGLVHQVLSLFLCRPDEYNWMQKAHQLTFDKGLIKKHHSSGKYTLEPGYFYVPQLDINLICSQPQYWLNARIVQ